MRKHLLLSCFVLLIGAFVLVGCGQEQPSITTTNAQPSNLKIKGTVYTTELAGGRGAGISGAYVYLSGDAVSSATTTNSLGEYLFSNIPDGDYKLVVTAEGHQRISTTPVYFKEDNATVTDGCIDVDDILLSSRPIAKTITPTPTTSTGTEIDRNPTFVITFNETMEINSVLPSLTINGLRAFSDSGTVPLSASWNNSNTVLTLTTVGSLTANTTCTLDIDPLTSAKDTAGYPLIAGSSSVEEGETLTPVYRVDVGGKPGTPSGLTISSVASKMFTRESTGVNFTDVATVGANAVVLYWDAPTTGPITGYNVYAAYGSTGNYFRVAQTTTPGLSTTLNAITTAIYGVNLSSLDPLSSANVPMINAPLYIKVTAYNGDGESASIEANAKELVPPVLSPLSDDALDPVTKQVLANGYIVDPITTSDTGKAYIYFNEPLDISTVTTSNITVEDGGTYTVSVLAQDNTPLGLSGGGNDRCLVRINSTADITGKVVRVGTGVKDLAGNSSTEASSVTLD
ncbi:hypothetical protein A2246_01805 [candidate division WOR-1 bacterium RIFOXYA2_FULL_37_7]|nr:MAG: hypothetical protein A2246_01805 [candidate division WOR-1 bacterium RIFOXYA2_FULL_37_7]